jgi:peptidoglycan/xylan/chitin deacetylase (PgdA/CDA1 family)
MFFYAPIWGSRLPDKVLCLTFDDGPDAMEERSGGPQTLGLARFLHERGIPATFFVVGDRAKNALNTLVTLRDMGHLIGTHTDSHPDLVELVAQGVNPTPHVLEADILIRNTLFSKETFLSATTFFRSPFGRWRSKGLNISQVADPLNKEKLLARCVGPIHWDIDSKDWICWRDGLSVEASAELCLAQIEKKGKGIVLLHDSNVEDELRNKNNTYALCRVIIPELQKRGYRFVRLDAIPHVRSAALVSKRFSLKTLDGKYFISIDPKSPKNVLACVISLGEHEEFGLIELGGGQVAIRVYNGEFLSVYGVEGGYYCSFKPEIGASELFQLIQLAGNKVALKVAGSECLISIKPGRDIQPVVSVSLGDTETFLLDIL